MSVALRTITRLQDADDINVSLGVGVDEYALVYDHDTARFVLRAMAAGVTDHGALTGLSDDDHSIYLLATGARTGASAAAQAFTNGIIGPSWKPAADSTTALQLQNAAGNGVILNVDTTNKRVGVNTVAPAVSLDIANLTNSANASINVYAYGTTAVGNVALAGTGNGFVYSAVGFGRITGGAFQRGWSYEYQDTTFSFLFRQNNRGAGSGTWYDRLAFLDGTPASAVTITSTSGMTIPGNVGIGTTSPATRLDIDAGAMTMAEMTAPTGVANKAMLYTKDNGSGKTQLCCKLGDNVEIVLATQA